MFSNILIGISYALSAGLQPGPLQAFFLAKVAKNGWRKTLPAAFSPLLSDGPIALLSIFFINKLPALFQDWLGLGGGILLLYFAWTALRSWMRDEITEPDLSETTPRTIYQAALINLLNPNPYLGWSLVMGPAVMSAWGKGPGNALALLLAFYVTMISTSMALIYLMGRAVLRKPGARKMMSMISAVLLAGLGLYFLYQAGVQLLG